MSFTGVRLVAVAHHIRTVPLTLAERAVFEHHARTMAAYLIGQSA